MLVWLVLLSVVFLLALMAVTAVSHWITETPYGGTSKAVRDAMIRLAGLRAGERVVDIGAGDGRILIAAERSCPGIHAVGYEFAPGVWLAGQIRRFLLRSPVELRLGNALRADFSQVDVVFLYLASEMMRKAEAKFRAELRPGARIVSHFFRLPDVQPERVEQVRVGRRIRPVYLYRWKTT